jgi:hypothetical protein
VSPVAAGEARTKKAARPLTKRLKDSANGQYALRSIYRNRLRTQVQALFGHVFGASARLTLVFYRRRAFEQEVIGGEELWRAFDKTVRRWPLAVAADASG